jgi:hypothetical protein
MWLGTGEGHCEPARKEISRKLTLTSCGYRGIKSEPIKDKVIMINKAFIS